jgi:thioredoxin
MFFAGAIALVSCGGGTANQSKKSGQKQSITKTIPLTKADFLKKIVDFETNHSEWNYLGDKPAIIDFWAEWCAPCKTIAPILEELAAEYEGRLYIYKVNTEKERELTAAFGIKAIPSLLFIPMNEEPQMATGALPRESLKEMIDKFLLNDK